MATTLARTETLTTALLGHYLLRVYRHGRLVRQEEIEAKAGC